MFNFTQWKISSFVCMFIPIYCPHFYHSKRNGLVNSFLAIEARVNNVFDTLMEGIRRYFKDGRYDPYKLEDKMIWNAPVEFPPGIEWKNKIDLINGQMHNLSTLHRRNDATLEYSPFSQQFELRGYVAFDHIKIIYDFAANLMNIGSRGTVVAHIPHMRATFHIAFKADSGQVKTVLKKFEIEETKDVHLYVEGFGILNPCVTQALKGTLFLKSIDYKHALLHVLEDRLKTNVENALIKGEQFSGDWIRCRQDKGGGGDTGKRRERVSPERGGGRRRGGKGDEKEEENEETKDAKSEKSSNKKDETTDAKERPRKGEQEREKKRAEERKGYEQGKIDGEEKDRKDGRKKDETDQRKGGKNEGKKCHSATSMKEKKCGLTERDKNVDIKETQKTHPSYSEDWTSEHLGKVNTKKCIRDENTEKSKTEAENQQNVTDPETVKKEFKKTVWDRLSSWKRKWT